MTNKTIAIFRNLALPPSTSPVAAGLLKILIAAHNTGTAVEWTDAPPATPKSKLPYWVELSGSKTKLYDANAVVRYLHNTGSLPLTTRLAVEQVLEWEEKHLSSLAASAEKSVGCVLAAAEGKIKHFGDKVEACNSVDAVLFGTLYHSLTSASEETLGRHLVLQQWYKDQISKESVAAALPAYKANVIKVSVRVEPTLDNRQVNSAIEYKFDPNEIVLPKDGVKNILITSALPYVNNVPHLGNIVGSTLSADVFARYSRLRGNNTLYICGTDEYGTATETKALADGVSCQELCDKYNAVHSEVYEWFNLSFNYFGRTTSKKQTEIVQDTFTKCYQNGYISEQPVTQLYCEKCDRSLADRFVEGICPFCKYDDARGDQCDACGKPIDAIELIKPRCKLDGNKPVVRESKHLFLDLDKLQPQCEAMIKRSFVEGCWSSNGVSITNNWLKEGLRPRCITRDLRWGVPVPLAGYENKVFYVWFDACIGYPSITACYTDGWEKWWKNPDNVNLYQFMGKDNVPFHSVMFPCSQIASGENWTTIHHISACGYLNYESGKFSKSRGVGVFGNNARETGVPADVWRYFLLANRPEAADSVFGWPNFVARNNNELLASVGNLCSRIIKFIDSTTKYAGVLPPVDQARVAPGADTADRQCMDDVNTLLAHFIEQMDAVHLKAGLKVAMEIAARGNLYLQESKLDNSLFSDSRPLCDTVVTVAANLIYLLSVILHPFMPATAAGIARQLNAPERVLTETFEFELGPGHVIGKPGYLFTRINNPKIKEWRQKYAMSQL